MLSLARGWLWRAPGRVAAAPGALRVLLRNQRYARFNDDRKGVKERLER
jgi:hypothetical protein